MNPRIFLGYVRVSTNRQDLSTEAQTDAVQRAADYHAGGVAVFELFAECDTSGTTEFAGREQGAALLQRTREALAEGLNVTIIVPKLDRLGRDTDDVRRTVQLIESLGDSLGAGRPSATRIIFLDLNVDSRTAIGRLIITVVAACAEMELARIRERINDALGTKFEKREVCGEVPFGWDAVIAPAGQTTKGGNPIRVLVDNPEEQKWILHMAGLRQQGLTFQEIARDLKARGIPTKKGGEWKAARVEKILHNKTVQHWLQQQLPYESQSPRPH